MLYMAVMILILTLIPTQDVELEKAAVKESMRFLSVVTGPTEATGIRVVYLTEPKAKFLGLIPGRNEYEVIAKIRLESTTEKSKAMLKSLDIDGVQELNNIIYFVSGKPIQDSLYLGYQLLHIEGQQWKAYKETLPDDAERSERITRWVVQARKAFASKNDILSKDFPKESLSQLKYAGVKFHVYQSHREGRVRLYRLLLANGHRVYTADEAEVATLTSSPEHQAKIEPMDAYVATKEMPGTVRLYRFGIDHHDGNRRQFLTAFEPEMKDVARRDETHIHKMTSFVLPHTYKPLDKDKFVDVVPVHSFYCQATGEHFYTTSESEKKQLIERHKSADSKGKQLGR